MKVYVIGTTDRFDSLDYVLGVSKTIENGILIAEKDFKRYCKHIFRDGIGYQYIIKNEGEIFVEFVTDDNFASTTYIFEEHDVE